MTDIRDLPDAIQWHEGMLLSPQHFQQSDLRNEGLLHYHLRTAAPFHWGIRKLAIDQVLLIDGVLRILEVEAIMPDGLEIYHQHKEDEKPLEIRITPYADRMKTTPLTFHLAVPAKRTGMSATRGILSRYESAEGDPVADENTGDAELSIPRLRPMMTLLTTAHPPHKYTSFPLLKIIYKNEIFTLTDYIPPTLTVSTRSPVWEICMSVAQRIREKAVFLSEKINSPASVIKGAAILEHKLMIHHLVSGLPHFEALVHTGVSHPFALYLSLCHLAGNMAGLGGGLIPPVSDAYDHHDIRAVFKRVQGFIFRMIDQWIQESHTAILFNFDQGEFVLQLKEEWILLCTSLTIGVRQRPGTTEHDAVEWIRESLIGSESVMESMKEKRILGAERRRIISDGELVPLRGMVLFSISADPAFIKPNELLHIFNASDPAGRRGPVNITLYIRNVL